MQTWLAEAVIPQKHLFFSHGALAYAGRHSGMFDWLVQQSEGALAIHAADLVGHGLSSGARAQVESFSIYVEDTLNALEMIKQTWGDAPTVFMGHSMGGLVLLKTLLEEERRLPILPRALILSNPCIRPVQVVSFPHAQDLFDGMASKLPWLRFPRRLKGNQLAVDPEAANQFDTDPLIAPFMTARMAHEVWTASQGVRALSYFVNVPTLFLVSSEDAVVDREATLLFGRGIDKRWARIIEYENTRHELLHEAIRHKVWRDVWEWTKTHTGAP